MMAHGWMRTCVAVLAVVCAWASSANAVAAAAASNAEIVSFDVFHDRQQTVFASSGPLRCSFSFVTPTQQAAAAADSGADGRSQTREQALRKLSAVDVLRSLQVRSVCVSGRFRWLFRLCIGGQARQVERTGVFALGSYKKTTVTAAAVTQVYNGGSPCDALHGRPRETLVSYYCGKTLSIAKVVETTTCRYSMDVLLPDACGVPDFPQQYGSSGGVAALQVAPRTQEEEEDAAAAAHDDGGRAQEPWVMELLPVEGGAYICQVYAAVDMKKEGTVGGLPTVAFQSWKLAVSVLDGSEVAHVGATARLANGATVDVTAVSPQRQQLEWQPQDAPGGGARGLAFMQGIVQVGEPTEAEAMWS